MLLIIKKYYEQKLISKELSENEQDDLHTEIVDTLMTWSRDKPYCIHQLRKKRRINK